MLLAISTAQNQRQLALLEQEIDSKGEISWKLSKEELWLGKRDDVEQLVPRLQTMLEELGLTKADLSGVLVVHGPGPFTSLRTGVVFANTIADSLKIPLYKMHSFEFMWRRVAGLDPLVVLLNAGGMDVALQVYDPQLEEEAESEESNLAAHFNPKTDQDPSPQIGPISNLLAPLTHDHYKVVSTDLKETLQDELQSIALEKNWKQVEGHELLTLAEVIMTYGLESLAKAEPMGEHGIIQVESYYLSKSVVQISKDKWKK